MRYLVTWTSPVIYHESEIAEAESIGVYGVEGSKPGAAAGKNIKLSLTSLLTTSLISWGVPESQCLGSRPRWLWYTAWRSCLFLRKGKTHNNKTSGADLSSFIVTGLLWRLNP